MDRRTVFIGGLLFFTTALIILGVVYLAVRLSAILTSLILAWILSSGLAPLVRRLERRGFRPGSSLTRHPSAGDDHRTTYRV